jgi:uncharacterized membrane protein
MRLRTRVFKALLLLILFVTPAFARSYKVSDFHSTISVDKNGGVFVVERISFAFEGQYNGVYRTIPVEYPGPNGTNYSLFLKVSSVTDDAGQSLKYESKRDGAYRKLKIYVPGAEDATKTVVISYSAPNATRFFDDHDEFYWNVTGNDWTVPIDRASALVQFPSNTSGSLRAQAFTGAYGSHSQEATAQVNGSQVQFETTSPLSMREGLTIDVYIPQGELARPGALTRAIWFLRGNPGILIPLWAFAVMFTMWYLIGRDPDPGLSVAPMYEPPKDLTPAEAGTLIDDSTDPRDITCTIVDLAVKGYLTIHETQDQGVFFKHKDYELELLKPADNNLAAHEQAMLNNIFSGGGQRTTLSSLKNRFYTAIPTIKQNIKAELKNKGMYLVDPDSAHVYTIVGALIVAAPFVLLAWSGISNVFDSPSTLIGGGLIGLAIVILFGRIMGAKSVLGGRTRIHILGFQEFMNRVDADRLKRMPPDTFEKYLPYAMALGVEHQWARAFQGLIQNPPTWYVPYGGYGPGYPIFNPIFFTNSMGSMASTAHDVFVSAPRASSSGSGFGGGGFSSGGGFSGGGFGGGGGGAF